LEISWGQSQIADSSHFVVLTTLKKLNEEYVVRYVNDMAKTRGIPVESLNGYRDMMVTNIVQGKGESLQNWTQKQAYIAMGNLLSSAALLGIDATPMEGLDPTQYDQILQLTNTPYATVAAVALGYRHADDALQHAKKVRFATEQIIETV
jgi:nitroreductase